MLLLLGSGLLAAQPAQPYFQAYTTEEGLGGEGINDVLVDRYGYVWTAAFSGLHQFDGYEFREYPADSNDSCSLSNRIVLCLLEDTEGNLWAGTRAGLNRFDRARGCFRRYFHDPERSTSLPNNEVIDLLLDDEGQLLVQTRTGTARYDPVTDAFHRLPAPAVPWQGLSLFHGQILGGSPAGIGPVSDPARYLARFAAAAGPAVHCLFPHGDTLLLGTDAGLYHWNGRDSLIRPLYPEDNYLSQVPILDIERASVHGVSGLWLASRGEGMGFLYLPQGWGGFYQVGTPRAFGLLDNHVRSLTTDAFGSLWIGTFVGLNRLDLSGGGPGYYRNSVNDGLGEQVLELHADPAGRVFFYERWRGLYLSAELGRNADSMAFPRNDFLREKDLNHLYTDRQGITWMLRGHDALYRYDAAAGRFLSPVRSPDFLGARLNYFEQDPADDGTYWLATDQGLARLRMPGASLEWWRPSADYADLSGDVITTLLAGADGRIWLCAGNYYNDRIGYFDPATTTFRFLEYRVGDPRRIGGGRVKQLAQGANGDVWAAATQGLIRVNTEAFVARLITRVGENRVGSPEAVLTDEAGGVWFSTHDRIAHYRPDHGLLTTTTCAAIRQFGNAVATRLPDGRMLFGGSGGMVAVDPQASGDAAPNYPELLLREVIVNGEALPTDRPVEELTVLRLGPRQRNLTLRFSGLYFTRTRRLAYAYRLDGGAWQNLNDERSLSFANLAPGDYLLELRASDGQGNWNPEPRRLAISVTPIWYETLLARVGFVLLGLGILLGLGRLMIRRRLDQQELRQLQQLDAFKSRFLTNLTHEFRTPLTLILGPARRLREQNNPTVRREARRIDRQGRRLLGLINQLLDLRQLEEEKVVVERSPVYLATFIGELVEGFREAAAQKQQTLGFRVNEPRGAGAGAVEVDNSKVESIVTNLLANALKFTPLGGVVRVNLTEEDERWSLTVADSGRGVPVEERERIFDRFGRGDDADEPGSGIGLALARETARLLNGELSVESSELGGAAFRLVLPRHPAAVDLPSDTTAPSLSATPAPGLEPTEEHSDAHAAAPHLLIVEDDPDVLAYLTESLDPTYRVTTATDGNSGLEQALREIPDLVLSDVMMPGLSGLQLCTRLKTDRRTSHLPVLLLTARSADDHRLEGLEHGADAYLTKPFAERELHLRLRNLLTLREQTARRLREQWLGESAGQPPAPEPFLDELRQLINDRLDDPDLAVADLERCLGMSRSQLHRKLTATLGLSATKLITQLRLETAAVRLRTTTDPIAAVAYDCGFRDVSYFGKRFRARYGTSPGEWRKATAEPR